MPPRYVALIEELGRDNFRRVPAAPSVGQES